jgi:undecaprenyl-diphosphatase
MNIFQAIILGIVQGLTEFLPISSSAHLVLVPYFFGWEFPEQEAFVFNVLVQLGTIVAVIIYFWKDLVKIILDFIAGILKGQPFAEPKSKLGWYLIVATIPAGLVGLALKKLVEMAFNSVFATAIFLFVTAAILLIAEYLGKQTKKTQAMTWKDAIIIGCAQAISIFPGISRSGSTMAGALLRDFERPEAARFSFLMSIPIMLAAGGLEILDLFKMPALAVTGAIPIVVAGMISAAIVGYASIHWLLGFLKTKPLSWFSLYCFVMGAFTLFFGFYVHHGF